MKRLALFGGALAAAALLLLLLPGFGRHTCIPN